MKSFSSLAHKELISNIYGGTCQNHSSKLFGQIRKFFLEHQLKYAVPLAHAVSGPRVKLIANEE